MDGALGCWVTYNLLIVIIVVPLKLCWKVIIQKWEIKNTKNIYLLQALHPTLGLCKLLQKLWFTLEFLNKSWKSYVDITFRMLTLDLVQWNILPDLN
jgi:hypothetical protein